MCILLSNTPSWSSYLTYQSKSTIGHKWVGNQASLVLMLMELLTGIIRTF